MEAGGIEPPSEGLPKRASTCLARVFNLASSESPQPGRENASLSSFSPIAALRHNARGYPDFLTPCPRPTGTARKGAHQLIKRRGPTLDWQMLVCRGLTRPTAPRHATRTSYTPVESISPPMENPFFEREMDLLLLRPPPSC